MSGIFIWAHISVLHSRFFCTTAFSKKELRSGRGAGRTSFRRFGKINIMTLEARKIVFVQEFLKLQDENLIAGLEKLLQQQKSENENVDFSPMSLAQYQEETKQAIQDSEKQRFTDVKDLRKQITEWQ